MKLQREAGPTGPTVSGFTRDGFRIDGEATSAGVLLTPEWWRPWDGVLDSAALEPLIALAPEFVIIGTGGTLVRPNRTLVSAIEARGIGIEIMDSRAAARAWGVLRGEGRWIAAALAPLSSLSLQMHSR